MIYMKFPFYIPIFTNYEQPQLNSEAINELCKVNDQEVGESECQQQYQPQPHIVGYRMLPDGSEVPIFQ